jgi:hypothetical protein
LSVAHTYNPRHSGGRDQEDHSSKTAQANSLRNPILKNPSQERAQGVGSEFKPPYCKNKQTKNQSLKIFTSQRVERLPLHPTCVRKKLPDVFLYFEKELLFSVLPGPPGKFCSWESTVLCTCWSSG